jgi:hypothetical protein
MATELRADVSDRARPSNRVDTVDMDELCALLKDWSKTAREDGVENADDYIHLDGEDEVVDFDMSDDAVVAAALGYDMEEEEEEEEDSAPPEPDMTPAEARAAIARVVELVARHPDGFGSAMLPALNTAISGLNRFVPELAFTKQTDMRGFFGPRNESLRPGRSPQRPPAPSVPPLPDVI